jgi:hypothetical protein
MPLATLCELQLYISQYLQPISLAGFVTAESFPFLWWFLSRPLELSDADLTMDL